MIMKKCNWCNEETPIKLDCLDEIDWNAVRIGRDGIVFSCPKHFDKLREYIMKRLSSQNTGLANGGKNGK
jgi:hypothetical protein